MQKCPFCGKANQDKAITCRRCGQFLDAAASPRFAKEGLPWYFRTSFIVFAVACVGPLALPLIWWRPGTRRVWKIGLTIGILLLSWILFQATVESIQVIKEYYNLMEQL